MSNTTLGRTSRPKACTKRAQLETATPTAARSEASQTTQGQIRAIEEFTARQIGATISLDSSVLKWLDRHAARTLTTLHVGSAGVTAHQRIRGKVYNPQIELFRRANPFQTKHDCWTAAEIRCELVGRLLAWIQYDDGRTQRELQCSNGGVSQCSETKQRRALELGYRQQD